MLKKIFSFLMLIHCFLITAFAENIDVFIKNAEFIIENHASNHKFRITSEGNVSLENEQLHPFQFEQTQYFAQAAGPIITSVGGPATFPSTYVTATGSNLINITELKVNYSVVDPKNYSSSADGTSVQYLVDQDLEQGTYNLTITTPLGTATSTGKYVNNAPYILGVNPSTGPTSGGTTITISGDYFTQESEVVTRVTIGGKDVPFTTINSETLSIVSPSGSAGNAGIKVYINDLASTNTGFFRYVRGGAAVTNLSAILIPPNFCKIGNYFGLVSWSPLQNFEGLIITGYQIYRSIDQSLGDLVGAVNQSSHPFFIDTMAIPLVNYQYTVIPVDANGSLLDSTTVTSKSIFEYFK